MSSLPRADEVLMRRYNQRLFRLPKNSRWTANCSPMETARAGSEGQAGRAVRYLRRPHRAGQEEDPHRESKIYKDYHELLASDVDAVIGAGRGELRGPSGGEHDHLVGGGVAKSFGTQSFGLG